MRLLRRSLVLVGVLTVGTATMALAAPPHGGCPVGPSSGNSTIGPWELMTVEMLATAIAETGGDPAQAEGLFPKTNRNGDQFVCTMTQILPNDASGSDTYFVIRDNTAAAN